MPTRTTDEQTTHTFRAATLEEAVALAEQTLGCRVTLVAANRIRRGGLGGFFAADLGVEAVVSPIEETVESALERLISSSANEERARWEADHKDSTAAVAAALAAVVAGDSAPTESAGRSWLRRRSAAVDEMVSADNTWYSPPTSDHDRGNRPERLARLAELDRVFGVVAADVAAGTAQLDDPAPFVDNDPTGRIEIPAELRTERAPVANEPMPRLPSGTPSPIAAPSPAGSSSLARVERIIEELQVLTSTPRLLAAMGSNTGQRITAAPPAGTPARRAPMSPTSSMPSADVAVAARRESQDWAPVGTRPAPGMIQRPSWPTTTRADEAGSTPTVSLATPRAIHSASTVPSDVPAAGEVPAARAGLDHLDPLHASSDASAAATVTASADLTQRQVELAVSAADSLLGSLRREDGVKRLSVRVILRTGDHDEVAAEAEWDAGE